jgi:adenylate cyclase
MAGMATLASCLVVAVLIPQAWYETIRERAVDMVLDIDRRLRPMPEQRTDARVIVVDIDRPSIEALGAWPWPRDIMARLVEAVAAAKPAAIAIDILFAEADSRSPAALARRLGTLTGHADLLNLADQLPDGDKRLAEALTKVPVVLGFVLDPDQTGALPAAPIMTRGSLPIYELWHAAGAVGPASALREAAQGLGALSLPGDADGSVRRVPLLVGLADVLFPGLALEAVRLARNASAYLIEAAPPMVRVADLASPLPRDALLRLVPAAADQWIARTVSAVDLVEGRADANRLAGAIVLIGGSAPELGGLRQTPSDPLAPSVQIQADAVGQIIAGRLPRAVEGAAAVDPLFLVAMGIVAIAAGAALPPLAGVLVMVSALVLSWAAAVGLSLVADRLLDPLAPSATAAAVFVATAVTAYAQTRRRAALVRIRFEQHLAPAVVRRIVEEPGLMKLSGERREVTALFTDIESFTAMTHRTDPEQLVALLDDYFEGAAAIIIEHGGMVDKLIGDAVHALFNAPIDLDDHPRRAVDCAIALRDWSENYRRGKPAAFGFGRTRIGIETGPAVVGDVGIRAKLDYTAHGDAINAAARLEAANKDLGSAICVGPAAAARCDPALFRPLGTIEMRGREEEALAVFEPWPPDAPPDWRERYLAAFAAINGGRPRAIALFEQLAEERPNDPVPRRFAERLRLQ